VNWLVVITGGIGLAVLVAAERETLRHLTTQIIMLLGQPLLVLMQWVGRALAALGGFIRDQANEEETSSEDPASAQPPTASRRPSGLRPHHLSRFVGAILLTALTLVCGAVETYLTKLSLGPMLGMSGGGDMALAGLLDWMGAAALMAVSVFWGLVLVDLYKGTFLLPRHFLYRMRKPLLTVGWSCLTLSLTALAVVGIWRGTQVAPVALAAEAEPAGVIDTGSGGPAAAPLAAVPADEQQPGKFSRFAEVFFPTSLSVLTGVTVLFSFTGVVMMFRYLGLAALAALMIPLALLLGPLRLLEQILVALRELKDRVLDLAACPGQWLVETFGPPLGDLRRWAHARIHRALTGEAAVAPPPAATPRSVLELAVMPVDRGSADQRPGTVGNGHEQEAVPAPPAAPESEDLKDWNWDWSDQPRGGVEP